MKKRFVIPGVLLGALLALPGSVLAQSTYTVGQDITMDNLDTDASVEPATDWGFGVTLNPAAAFVAYWNGVDDNINLAKVTDNPVSSFNTYNLQNITVKGAYTEFDFSPADGAMDPIPTGAVQTNDMSGHFSFGNITLTKSQEGPGNAGSEFHGFMVMGNGAFTGEIKGGTITVHNDDAHRTAGGDAEEVFGLIFSDNSGGSPPKWAEVNGNVTLDKIDITGAGGTALVMDSIAVGKTVKVGTVLAKNQNYANGVDFSNQNGHGDGNFNAGTLEVDNISVVSTDGDATALRADAGMTGTAKIGNARAASKNGDASAITTLAGDIENLEVAGTVEGVSENGAGYAMKTAGGNVAYTAVGPNTVITGSTGGILTGGGNLVNNLSEGAHATISSAEVGGGDLTFNGPGKATVQKVVQTGTSAELNVTDGAVVDMYYTDDSSLADGANTKNVAAGSGLTIHADKAEALQDYLDDFTNTSVVDVKAETGDVRLEGGVLKALGTNSLSNGFVTAASMHQRYSAWNAINTHLISGGMNRTGFRGQECDPCDPIGACDPCGTFGGEKSLARSAWVNYVGRGEEYDAAFNGGKWKLGMDGVQVGTDLYKTTRNQLGVIFGYEGGDLSNGYNHVDADDIYAGVYGAHVFNNGIDLRGSFAYGWQDFTMLRQNQSANRLFGSKFNGNTSETTVELGKRMFNGNWSLRPVFGIDVMTNDLDAAQEALVYGPAGGTAYNYGETDFTQVFLRIGTDLRYQLRRLTFNSGLYYSYDVNDKDLVAYADYGGTAPVKLVGSDMGRELLTFNVGGEYQIGKNFSVFGGYQGQSVLDTDTNAYQSIGYVGGAWKW